MKKIEWAGKNKMRFESEYKAFNKRADYIGTGNVISNVQHSTYVRPWSETMVVRGEPCEQGALRKFDISVFSDITPLIRSIIMSPERRETKMIVYRFRFYHSKARGWTGLGWVITDENHREIYHITDTEYAGRNCRKTEDALEECMKYICEAA